MSIEELERIVEVVKYKTQVVKVENVYQFSSQRVAQQMFYMKVLIKQLLHQLGEIATKFNIEILVSEGMLAMVKAELLDIIEVQQIFQIFAVLPKILEVERVVINEISRPTGYLTQAIPIFIDRMQPTDQTNSVSVVLH